jgi:hypothetical protein
LPLILISDSPDPDCIPCLNLFLARREISVLLLTKEELEEVKMSLLPEFPTYVQTVELRP